MISAVHRLLYLDSSRGLAALIVMLSHFHLTILSYLNDTWLMKTPVYILFDGQSAVLYFFILSGFVLTLSLKDKEALTIKSYFRFILIRFFRIFPAFIFTLIVTIIIIQLIDIRPSSWLDRYWTSPTDLISFLKQSILIIRFPYESSQRLIPHDWTLTIEIAISLLLPFLALLARNKAPLILLFCYCAVQFLKLDPFVFDFSLGIYIAVNIEFLSKTFRETKLRIPFILFAIFIITSDYYIPSIMDYADIILIHHKSWGLSILLLTIISSTNIQRILSIKPLIYLGRISYSFYLLHLIILLLMTIFFNGINPIILLLIYFVSTAVFSWISWKFVEVPFNKFGKSILNK